MLVELKEVNGEIKMMAVEEDGSIETAQHLIDQVVEETTLEEVYVGGDTDNLSPDYEEYYNTQDVIVGEIAVLLNGLIDNLRKAGYKIVRN